MRPLINRDEVLCPGTAGSTAVLKFLHESLASASIRGRHQHTPDHRAEVVIQEPGVLKAEASATWDFCAGSEEEWNMIRAKASQGGEESVGKDIIPFHVDKASVQLHESGLLTLITLGVSSVRQRDLDETKRVDEVVETICFRGVEVVIVLVHRSASEVEVTHNDPWSTNVSGNGSKFREEALLIFVAGRGINIGKSEFSRVLGKAEAGGERVLFASRGGHCAEVVIPSGQNSAGRPNGVTCNTVAKPAREEGGRPECRQRLELGFLERSDDRPCRDKLCQYIFATGSLSKSANVPRAKGEIPIHGTQNPPGKGCAGRAHSGTAKPSREHNTSREHNKKHETGQGSQRKHA